VSSGLTQSPDKRMKKRSAGILLFRRRQELEVFLVHPGGPFGVGKDAGAWSIPKGEYGEDEEPLAAAKREFQEETGVAISGNFLPLGQVTQLGGKVVTAWALEHDLDPELIKSNSFEMEWPPRSGKMQEFPEVDYGGWFSIPIAATKLLKRQEGFLARLVTELENPPPADAAESERLP
jgi:predicted NUDIX family NTP pyrophosphohydrolase